MKKLLPVLFTLGLFAVVSPSDAQAVACNTIGNRTNCESSCSNVKANGATYRCVWRSQDGVCRESSQECTPPAGGGGQIGNCAAITGSVTTYYCQGNPPPDTSGGCQDNDPLPAGVRWNDDTNSIVGSFCGTVQVDDNDADSLVFCSSTDTSGCSSTTPPATPPSATAMCQDIKPYTATGWIPMTYTQMTQLRAGNQVFFCSRAAITSGTVSGSFTKAQFKVNGAARTETTTTRPGGANGEFCDLYTIPSGITTFEITSSVFHTVLGWISY